jgi:hypothetical protein
MPEIALLTPMVLCIVAEIAIALRMAGLRRIGDGDAARRYVLLVYGVLCVVIALDLGAHHDRLDRIVAVVLVANAALCAAQFLRLRAKAGGR